MTKKKLRKNLGASIRKATGLQFSVAMSAAKAFGKKFPLDMIEKFGDAVIVESYHCCEVCGTVMSVKGFAGPKGEWRPS